MKSDDIRQYVTNTNIIQEGDPAKIGANLPVFTGRHLWIFTAIFQTNEPAREQQNFDTENLLSIIGPACWYCEQVWYPSIGSKCLGDPSEDD